MGSLIFVPPELPSSIDLGALLEDDKMARVRLLAIKHAATTPVARVMRLADPRDVIRPPIVPPPIPSAPPSLR